MIAAKVPALEAIWFIRDEFCDSTFTTHYKLRKIPSENGSTNTYILQNYDVAEFSATRYSSSIRNILARLKSQLLHAMSDKT